MSGEMGGGREKKGEKKAGDAGKGRQQPGQRKEETKKSERERERVRTLVKKKRELVEGFEERLIQIAVILYRETKEKRGV